MRISVDKSDPGWRFLEARGGPRADIRVLLDGVEQAMVYTADDVEGIIVTTLD